MKNYIYTTKDSDDIYGMLAMSTHKHFMAEQIKAFYDKVGQYVPVKWLILGEYDTKTGKLEPYPQEEEFDWQKELLDTGDTKGLAVESKEIAQAIAEENVDGE